MRWLIFYAILMIPVSAGAECGENSGLAVPTPVSAAVESFVKIDQFQNDGISCLGFLIRNRPHFNLLPTWSDERRKQEESCQGLGIPANFKKGDKLTVAQAMGLDCRLLSCYDPRSGQDQDVLSDLALACTAFNAPAAWTNVYAKKVGLTPFDNEGYNGHRACHCGSSDVSVELLSFRMRRRYRVE